MGDSPRLELELLACLVGEKRRRVGLWAEGRRSVVLGSQESSADLLELVKGVEGVDEELPVVFREGHIL